jgi:hypothetical protein
MPRPTGAPVLDPTGKAVLRSLIAPQVARQFFPLEAVSSPRPVDRRAKKDPSLALGQACPGSEQEGPARVAQCPHKRRSGARGRCLFAHRGKPGWHSAAVFEQPASNRVMVLSAVCPIERAATWRRGGGHRYVPCAINAVSVPQRKTRGCPASSQRDALPPRVGGFREAIAFGGDPQAVVEGIAAQRYSL